MNMHVHVLHLQARGARAIRAPTAIGKSRPTTNPTERPSEKAAPLKKVPRVWARGARAQTARSGSALRRETTRH